MAKEYEHLEADLASLKNELSEEQKNKRKLEQVLREAALSIKKVLVVRIAQPLLLSRNQYISGYKMYTSTKNA